MIPTRSMNATAGQCRAHSVWIIRGYSGFPDHTRRQSTGHMIRTAAENISKTRKTMEHCGSIEVPQPDSHCFFPSKILERTRYVKISTSPGVVVQGDPEGPPPPLLNPARNEPGSIRGLPGNRVAATCGSHAIRRRTPRPPRQTEQGPGTSGHARSPGTGPAVRRECSVRGCWHSRGG